MSDIQVESFYCAEVQIPLHEVSFLTFIDSKVEKWLFGRNIIQSNNHSFSSILKNWLQSAKLLKVNKNLGSTIKTYKLIYKQPEMHVWEEQQ